MKDNPIIKRIFWKDVFLDWGVIVSCFFLIANTENIWAIIMATVLIGIEQYRILILFHDLMHRTIFRKKQTNFLVGNLLIGWWIGVDINSFNRFHSEHHAYSGQARDPEMRDGKGNPMMQAIGRWDLPMTPLKILFWVIFEIILGPILAVLFVLGMKVRTDEQGEAHFCWNECIAPGLFLGTVGLFLWAIDAMWVMGIWFLAYGFVFNAVFNLRLYTEHLGCAEGETVVLAEPTNWYEWLYAVTSGAHNIRYHLEHHDNAKIPYMLLPEKRKEYLGANVKTVKLKDVLHLLATSPVIKSGETFKVGDTRSLIYRIKQFQDNVEGGATQLHENRAREAGSI